MRHVRQVVAMTTVLLVTAACGAGAGATVSSSPAGAAASPELTPSPSVPATQHASASPAQITPSTSLPEMTNLVSNRYPYSIWIPSNWTTGDMGDADAFEGPAGEQIDVRYYESISGTPDAWFAKASEVLSGFAPIEKDLAVTHPAGQAHWYELHPTNQGQTLTLFRLVLIAAGGGWDVTWVSPAGSEDVDRPLFVDIANQFWPSTGPLNVWSLNVGDCFSSLPITQPGDGGSDAVFVGPLDQFARVACTEPHTGEIFAALKDVSADCGDAFEAFVGRPLAGSSLKLLEFVPLHAADLPDGIASLCVVADPKGTSTGTAGGSAR
jgi:hypothetical protein